MSDFTQQTVVDLMREQRFVMLTCVSDDGTLHSHPMTPQRIEDDADAYFFIDLSGDQAHQLRANPEVNLAFVETGSWLSVAGRVTFVEDGALIDELWSAETSAWFDGGKDDPSLGLLHFDAESAQYWGTPGGKLSAIATIVKAKVTGDRPSGTSETLEL